MPRSESASGEESVSGDSDGDTLEVAAGTAAVPVVSDLSVATMNHHVQPSPSVAPAIPVDSGLRASLFIYILFICLLIC